MKQPSALFILNHLTTGGIQTQALLLAKYLKNELGFDVTFWWALSKQPNYTSLLDKEEISYRRIPDEISFLLSREYGLLNKAGKIKKIKQAIEVLNAGQYQVVFPFAGSKKINFIYRFTKVKVSFVFERGGHPAPQKKPRDMYEWLGKMNKPVFVANSYHGARAMEVMHGLPVNSAKTIRNAFVYRPVLNIGELWEEKLKNKPEDEVYFVMVANYFPEKDQDTIIDAWNELRPKNAKMFFAGLGGPQYCKDRMVALQAKVKTLGLEDDIRFLGSVRDTTLLLQYADVGVLSTKSEGCPNAILEYMGAGLPIIATDVPGIREVLPSSNLAFLFEYKSVKGFSEKLSPLLHNKSLRKKLGDENYVHVRKAFNPEKMYCAYKEILVQKKVLKE